MKYLIIHNRYHHISGPETYLFNIKEQLESRGHSVDIFALNYSNNLKSEHSELFPNPIGDPGNYSYANQNLSFQEKLMVLKSLFFRKDVSNALKRFLQEENFDRAIVLQFWGKLSPSIFHILNKNFIPYIVRISDYGLICSKNTFYRNGKICTKCIKNPLNGVFYKCIDKSFIKSIINFFALCAFSLTARINKISFITTNEFAKNIFKNSLLMKSFTYKSLVTFSKNNMGQSKKVYYDENKIINLIYFGRVSEDKGIDFLCKTLQTFSENELDLSLQIIGRPDSFMNSKKNDYSFSNGINVSFLDERSREELMKKVENSHYSIIPSIWFDNLPNSLIESLSYGVPVIAPNHGCFPEFIQNKFNGFLYNSNDIASLKKLLLDLKSIKKRDYNQMRKDSEQYALKKFSSKTHTDKLIKLLEIS